MKKFVVILCALLMMTVCAGAWAEEPVEEKVFVLGEDLVLAEQDGVRIVLRGEQNMESVELAIIVENTNDIKLSFSYFGMINGVEFGSESDRFYLCRVNPNSWENSHIWFDTYSVPLNSFYDFETMNLTFSVDDPEHGVVGYMTLETGPVRFETLEESNESADAETPEEEETDNLFVEGEALVLLDQNGVKLTLTGECNDEGRLMAILENNTDKEVRIDHAMSNPVNNDLIILYIFSYENPQYNSSGVKPGESYEYAIARVDRCYAAGEVSCDIMVQMLVEGNVVDDFNTRETIFFEKEYETHEIGSKGDAVVALQKKLADAGVIIGAADGIYGKGTAEAVRVFQEMNGLEQTGIADPETQRALFAR